MPADNSNRLRRNAESKAHAVNDGQPWASEELDWLESWDGTEPYLAELAELLGRTIEACREKFYKVRRHGRGEITVTRTTTTTVRTTRTTTTTYRGWMESDGDGWE